MYIFEYTNFRDSNVYFTYHHDYIIVISQHITPSLRSINFNALCLVFLGTFHYAFASIKSVLPLIDIDFAA
jgi:hypothetical protein